MLLYEMSMKVYAILSQTLVHVARSQPSPPYMSRKGMGTLSSVFTFYHERAPISCLQRLDALTANNWTNSSVQQGCQ